MKFLDKLKALSNKTPEYENSYDLFLSMIDELSATRLRAIDMAVDIIKHNFLEEGFVLSETDCVSPLIRLGRNQFGFYVDETKSLNSKEEYKNYLYGLQFLESNKDTFKRLDQLLIEKEIIMRGSYNVRRGSEEEVSNLAISLGYGIARDKAIYEDNPIHPGDEYVQLQILLDLVNNENVKSFDKIIEKALKRVQSCLTDNVTLEIKRIDDKYDRDFDHTYGIMLVDNVLGEVSMLYYSDGVSVRMATIDKYLVEDNPYLLIYMRIILKCLQKELSLNNNKSAKK